jgi:hypothetical protein
VCVCVSVFVCVCCGKCYLEKRVLFLGLDKVYFVGCCFTTFYKSVCVFVCIFEFRGIIICYKGRK